VRFIGELANARVVNADALFDVFDLLLSEGMRVEMMKMRYFRCYFLCFQFQFVCCWSSLSF
jgi:hypothetical protein